MRKNYTHAKERLLRELDNSGGEELRSLLVKLKDAISSDLSPDESINLVTYQEVVSDNVQGKRSHDLVDSIPSEAQIDEKYVLSQIITLRQENSRKLFQKILDPAMRILEVGSGTLDRRGDSFLSSAFGREIANRFEYCDINPNMVEESLSNNPNSRIKQCDIRSLHQNYPLEAFDLVIGHNVLDTLTSEQLQGAVEEIGKVLKIGGTLIHVMNMEPFVYSVVNDLCRDEHTLIPIFDDSKRREFLTIDNNTPVDTSTLSLSNLENHFLKYLLALPSEMMERLTNCLIHIDKKFILSSLGRKCKSIGKLITPMEYYTTTIDAICKAQGFTNIKQELATTEKTIRARINGPYEGKSLVYGPEGKDVANGKNLSWGESHLKIITHAIIAKENVSHDI